MRKILLGLVVAAVCAALLPGIGAAAQLAGSEVKIGYLTPLSGYGAGVGSDEQHGVFIARDEINAAGGIGGLPVKIIQYDDASKGEEAINLIKKLALRDKVVAIMGPFLSNSVQVAFPAANIVKTAVISSASVAPGIAARNRPWTFRNITTSEHLLEPALIKYLEIHPQVKKVAIVYDNKDFVSKIEAANVFPPLLKKHGVQIIDSVTFVTGDIDFSPQVTRIKQQKPDGIVMCAVYQEGSNLVRELRRQGMNQPILSGIGISSNDFMRLAGAAAEGAINAQPFWAGNPEPRVQKFVAEYRKRTGKQAPNYAASSYDTLYILKQIIETSGVTNKPDNLDDDRVKIRDGLANLKDFKGITGDTSMGPEGDAIKEKYVLIVKNGEFTRLK